MVCLAMGDTVLARKWLRKVLHRQITIRQLPKDEIVNHYGVVKLGNLDRFLGSFEHDSSLAALLLAIRGDEEILAGTAELTERELQVYHRS